MELVYLDSCIVIYLIERHPHHAAILEQKLRDLGTATLALSPLVQLEVLVKPMRDGNSGLVQLYHDFLAASRILPITDAIFDLALILRVNHNLKTPDAIHLATAQYYKCDAFWTNDDRLATAAYGIAQNVVSLRS
jgi:predicted nucleic acid-binding protein